MGVPLATNEFVTTAFPRAMKQRTKSPQRSHSKLDNAHDERTSTASLRRIQNRFLERHEMTFSEIQKNQAGISPARSAKGRLRNLKAMSETKFWNMVQVMPGYAEVDPAGMNAVMAEAARRS